MDYIQAYMWLTLAAAAATRGDTGIASTGLSHEDIVDTLEVLLIGCRRNKLPKPSASLRTGKRKKENHDPKTGVSPVGK
jgi:hypothetical protein